ncbi:MAG TPA: O-antigen ligase family protein [Actinomycetota bacterium]|nr:O-antigen ligase family protein [Actinomycetota bacterium]
MAPVDAVAPIHVAAPPVGVRPAPAGVVHPPGARRAATAQTAHLPIPALLLLAGLATGAAAQGGYHTAGQIGMAGFLGAALVASVAASFSARRPPWRILSAVPVPAAATLAAWAVVSGARAGDTRAALSIVGLLAGVAAVVIVCQALSGPQRELLVSGAVAVGALVALTGWAGVAFRSAPWALESSGLWRAATTLTYANAAAGLLVPLALVAMAALCGAALPKPPVTRPGLGRAPSPLLGAGAFVLTLGAVATLSRFGFLTLCLGFAILAALLGPGRLVRHAAAPVLGAGLALATLLPSVPGDHPARPLLAAAGLLAGLLIAVAGPAPVGHLGEALGRRRAAVALVALGVVAAGTLAVLAPTLHAVSAVRLNLASPARTQSTQAALRLAAGHPLTGVGPGNAGLSWAGPGGSRLFSRYAHDEYLQTLAELGAIGAGLLLVLLVSAAGQVARGRRLVPSRALWAGAVAGLAAFALHSGADFLWHIPVIPLTAALLIGITAPPRTTAVATPGGGSASPSNQEV